MDQGVVVEKLTKKYSRKAAPALAEVDLSISKGEIFGLVGPNGAGKTTFLCCLLGLVNPESGSITIDGMSIDDLRVKAMIGYVPERLQFDNWISGEALVALHHGLAGKSEVGRKQEVRQRLEQVGLANEAWKRPVRTYSRGMLQRVALAQALVGEPKFLFLDEPTSGMDPEGVMQVRDLLFGLKSTGVTIILNSHQLDQVEKLCDRVAFLKGGKVQSIEVAKAGGETARILMVRWIGEAGEGLLEQCADQAKAKLLRIGEREARFEVDRDETAAALLGNLAKSGLSFVEATPETSRLERLFLGAAPKEETK